MTKKNEKKKAADLIDMFKKEFLSKKLRAERGEWIISELQDLADDAMPLITKMLTSSSAETRDVALVLLQELDDPRAIKPLKQMLDKSTYSDEEKIRVLQVLEGLGVSIDEKTFQRAISDPDALMKRSIEQMLNSIEDPIQVEDFMGMFGEWPPEIQENYVLELLRPLTDHRLLLLLTAMLHSEHDSVVTAAITTIERIKEPATIPVLEERAQYDPSQRVRHAAENAALRLKTRIGEPEDKHLPWITPPTLPLAHCLLCTIDGSGGQVLFAAREQPDGRFQVLDVMFNDHQGIKDGFSTIMDEEELEDVTGSFGSCEFVDVSLERARAEINRAYQVTLQAQRRLPPAFIAWQGWLEGEDTRSIEEFPLPSLEPSQYEQLLKECGDLLDLDEFDFWFFNPEEIQDHVPHYRKLLRQGKAEEGDALFEALLDETITALVDDPYRQLLSARLRRQAWLLAQVYEEEEIPLLALAAASGLEKGPVVEHPLLRDMIIYSFINAAG